MNLEQRPCGVCSGIWIRINGEDAFHVRYEGERLVGFGLFRDQVHSQMSDVHGQREIEFVGKYRDVKGHTDVNQLANCPQCRFLRDETDMPWEQVVREHREHVFPDPDAGIDDDQDFRDRTRATLRPIPLPGKKPKARMSCNECGHHFNKTIGPKTFEVKCPKCGGYDTEVA